ncbi:MAG: MFS transporter [Planctomycetes bacterium]|nr:MFS transporter [Planctomycetota bacterium]
MPRLLNKQIISFILYDVANSAYILLIPAVGFAVYFREIVAGGAQGADLQWAVLVSLSFGVAGLLAPFVGAIADLGGLRRQLLIGSTMGCCLLAAALTLVGPGDVVFGGILFVGAQVFYTIAIALYDSYLRDLVPKNLAGRLSGIAWGAGYLGGIACLALVFPLLSGGLEEDNLGRYRLSFLVTAAFFLLVSIPAFVFLPRAAVTASRTTGVRDLLLGAHRGIWHTVKHWRNSRQVFKFLISYFLISDSIVAIIFFTSIYLAVNFDYTVTQILMLTVLIQAIGIPATAILGHLGDYWGLKRTIFVTLAIWTAVVLVMVLGTESYIPWVMAGLMGLVIGSTQSLCRSLYAHLVPRDRLNEFFGFSAFAGKLSSMFGPLAFGLVSLVTGSQRLGLLSLLVFFGLGGVLLLFVRVEADATE